jgi:tetratricopeptide (TPR) repeat protein
MAKRGPVIFFVSIFFIISAAYAVSQNQDYPPRLRSGINLYGEGNWREAVIELRRAQAEAPDTNQRAEALYWISLAELAAGEYEAAVRDMDELEALTPPEHKRRREIPYHRGRIFYF